MVHGDAMDITPAERDFMRQARGTRLPVAGDNNRMVSRLALLGLVEEVSRHGKQASYRATAAGIVEYERAEADRLGTWAPPAMEGGRLVAWTDYPLVELGDIGGREAPVRKVEPLSYDGDKYVVVRFGKRAFSFKRGYLYAAEGRLGDVPAYDVRALPPTLDGDEPWILAMSTDKRVFAVHGDTPCRICKKPKAGPGLGFCSYPHGRLPAGRSTSGFTEWELPP